MNRVYWMGVTAALACGGVLGYAVGVFAVEEKVRKRYEDAAAARLRAMDLAEEMQKKRNEGEKLEGEALGEPKVITHIDRVELSLDAQPNVWGEKLEFKPAENNPYHKALEVEGTPEQLFVEGAITDYGVSYIEEEEYYEEDGRGKYNVTIVLNDGGPVFLLDGEQQIEDWDERLGASILVDHFNLAQGPEFILYVRNHKTDDDYEVVRTTP